MNDHHHHCLVAATMVQRDREERESRRADVVSDVTGDQRGPRWRYFLSPMMTMRRWCFASFNEFNRLFRSYQSRPNQVKH
ncbi:hypothetical protein Hdeb2414_s0002g00069041 [Helianthus debilis subsp. tardiflorus]